jgi:hypothetical protein
MASCPVKSLVSETEIVAARECKGIGGKDEKLN